MTEHEGPRNEGQIQIDAPTRISNVMKSARLTELSFRKYVETKLGAAYNDTHLGKTFLDDTGLLWLRQLESIGEVDTKKAFEDPRMKSYHYGGLLAISTHLPLQQSLRRQILHSEARPTIAAGVGWHGTPAKNIVAYQESLDDAYRDLPRAEGTAVNLAIAMLCATVSTSTHDEHERAAARGYAAMAGTFDSMMVDLAHWESFYQNRQSPESN